MDPLVERLISYGFEPRAAEIAARQMAGQQPMEPAPQGRPMEMPFALDSGTGNPRDYMTELLEKMRAARVQRVDPHDFAGGMAVGR